MVVLKADSAALLTLTAGCASGNCSAAAASGVAQPAQIASICRTWART